MTSQWVCNFMNSAMCSESDLSLPCKPLLLFSLKLKDSHALVVTSKDTECMANLHLSYYIAAPPQRIIQNML